MDSKEIVYSLNVEDMQCVAQAEIGRSLSINEIANVKDRVQDSMPWYDYVFYAIADMQLESEGEKL